MIGQLRSSNRYYVKGKINHKPSMLAVLVKKSKQGKKNRKKFSDVANNYLIRSYFSDKK